MNIVKYIRILLICILFLNKSGSLYAQNVKRDSLWIEPAHGFNNERVKIKVNCRTIFDRVIQTEPYKKFSSYNNREFNNVIIPLKRRRIYLEVIVYSNQRNEKVRYRKRVKVRKSKKMLYLLIVKHKEPIPHKKKNTLITSDVFGFRFE